MEFGDSEFFRRRQRSQLNAALDSAAIAILSLAVNQVPAADS